MLEFLLGLVVGFVITMVFCILLIYRLSSTGR